MESNFEYIFNRKQEAPLERNFIDSSLLEENTGIRSDNLDMFRYSRTHEVFMPVTESTPKKGLEVLFHEATSTLIVPPPKSGILSTRDLAQMSLPVVGFIRKLKPDIIVGCDRGARLYSLAVHSMWRARYADEKLPTLSSQLHFARLSTSLPVEVTAIALRRIIEQSYNRAKQLGKRLNGENLRMMFIDDWIISGATREQILQSLDALGIGSLVQTSFALMCGTGGDVSGSSNSVSPPWHDNETVIGVGYTKKGKPYSVGTTEAKIIRRKLYKAVNEAAAALK